MTVPAVESGQAMNHSETGAPLRIESVHSAAAAPEHAPKNGPERTTRILLLAVVLGLCQQIYPLYRSVDRYQPEYWKSFIDGTGPAPEQYRIGVKLAAWWMVEHLGWAFRHGFLLMDVAGALMAVYLFYALLEQRRPVLTGTIELRWFASAAFVALICFYLMWVGSFFRPETLPITGLAALLVYLWSSWEKDDTRWHRARVAAGVAGASALLAWIRADVALLLNAGWLIGSLRRTQRSTVPHRTCKILASSVGAGLAAATQLYLMRVKYPHASYGAVPVLMIRESWRKPLNLPPFICFMVPIAWTYLQFWHDPSASSDEELDTGIVISSVMYLLLWGAMGKLNEVRIFVPFALALTPLTVELATRRISPNPAVGRQCT